MQTNAVLCAGRVDSYDRVKLSFSHATFKANGDALSDLSSVRCANMEANDEIILLVDEYLGVGRAFAICDSLVECPFQGLEPCMEGSDIGVTESLLSLSLSQADCAVLEWSKDRCGHVLIVHELGTASRQSSSQKRASLNGNWSQLKTAVKHVTDGVDVRHIGLLLLIHSELSVGLNFETCVRQVKTRRNGVSSNCKQDCVEGVLLLTLGIVVGHGDRATFLGSSQARWSSTTNEFSMVVRHMISYQIRHVFVKASQ